MFKNLKFYGQISFFTGFQHRHDLIQSKWTLDKYSIEYWWPLGSLTSQILKKFELEGSKHLIAEMSFVGFRAL